MIIDLKFNPNSINNFIPIMIQFKLTRINQNTSTFIDNQNGMS